MTPPDPAAANSWRSYLDWFHNQRPGITEDILDAAVADSTGMTPYRWLIDAAPPAELALDLACGSAPLQLIDTDRRWVGIDRSGSELSVAAIREPTRLVQGEAGSLPFCDNSFGLVICSMALMLFDEVGQALAEIRRVLAPGGTAIFLVPGSTPLSARDRIRYIRVLFAFRQLSPAYPNHAHIGPLSKRLARAGLQVTEDDRLCFHYPISDATAGRRFIESLYAPGCPERRVESAVRLTLPWVGSEIGVPLRRLVCIRKAM